MTWKKSELHNSWLFSYYPSQAVPTWAHPAYGTANWYALLSVFCFTIPEVKQKKLSASLKRSKTTIRPNQNLSKQKLS